MPEGEKIYSDDDITDMTESITNIISTKIGAIKEKNKTINDANDNANKQMIDKQEEQETDVKNKVINENVVKIYELLLNVTNGSAAFNVNMGDNSSWTRLLTGGFMD